MRNRLQQLLLPGIIFQSVLIGGAYGTGREIVEYGARFGRLGLVSIAAIFIGFTLCSGVAFEFARVHRAYDYRDFVRHLIGPLWPLFDALFIVMVVVIIAVVSAASGSVVESVLGWPSWTGFLVVVIVVAVLNASGRRAIERFKTFGTVLLYGGYLLFAGRVLWGSGSDLPRAMATEVTTSMSTAFGAGVLYVGYNLAVMPSTLFVLDRQTSRSQAAISAVISGLLATVPFTLTYLAIMTAYPDAAVLDAPVPWLDLLGDGGGVLLAVFAVVLIWTLIETSTGLIHAVSDRISAALEEGGRAPLSAWQAAAVTVGLLLGAALLSRVGLIDLVARGYSAMAYAFLILFALPLLTRGVVQISRAAEKVP